MCSSDLFYTDEKTEIQVKTQDLDDFIEKYTFGRIMLSLIAYLFELLFFARILSKTFDYIGVLEWDKIKDYINKTNDKKKDILTIKEKISKLENKICDLTNENSLNRNQFNYIRNQ